MHKPCIVWLCVLAVSVCPAWGQSAAGTDPSIKISNAVQAPSSSVDLLKQAVKKDSPFAAPAKAPRVPPKPVEKKMDPATNPVDNKQPVSSAPAETPAFEQVPANPTSATHTNTSAASQPQPDANVKPVVPNNTVAAQPSVNVFPGKKPGYPRGPRIGRPKHPRGPRIQTAPVSQQKVQPENPPAAADELEEGPEEEAADAEQEYAIKMYEKSKQKALQGRSVPPPAAKNKPSKVPSAKKKFNPNAFRPGVEWLSSKSTHFDIYTQKPNGQISSANMALAFETAYDTLRRFIPWMMSGRVRVFVYQDHDSYLRYEPEAKAWTRAIAYPTRGEIVVYDEPGHMQELKETFAHELTHIFTQQFFDKHDTGRIMTPTWLDEGLAVFVEDQMFAGKNGGPWNHDYRTLRFERDPKTMVASFGSKSMFGGFEPKPFVPMSQRMGPNGPRRGKPVRLQAFEDFMQESSLDAAEGQGEMQNWYLQAYLMVRFLLNPGGGLSPSNRMQFEQFTRLIAQGEAVRNPSTGFLVKDSRGKQVYEPYDVQKALSRAYRYNTVSAFEDAFWKWLSR